MPQPSLFNGFRNTKAMPVTWDEVYQLLTSGTLKEQTERLRYYLAQGLKKDAEAEKAKLPGITPAVHCKDARRKSGIDGYTGFSLADFDDIPKLLVPACLQAANTDPHTFLSHITASGEGIRIIFPVDHTEDYKEAFLQGNEYYARLIGHKYDPACKDDTRLSCLCHDPEAHYNPDAEAFHIEPRTQKERKKDPGRPRTVHHAIVSDAETAVLDNLCKRGLAYRQGKRNEYISQALFQFNRYGTDCDQTIEWIAANFPDYNRDEMESVARSVYANHADEHGEQKLPKQRPAGEKENATEDNNSLKVEEIEYYLEQEAEFRHNTITGQCEFRFLADGEKQPYECLTDRGVNTLWRRMSKSEGRTRVIDIYNVLNSDFVPLFNPFTEYFEQLPPWDGTTDHIARLADTVHTVSPHEQFVEYFRKWFVAIIAGIMDKSVVNHEILILIGAQGVYKTTWFTKLLPPDLENYFTRKHDCKHLTKDDRLALTEFALVCLEEIDEMPPSELNQLKALTTDTVIHERPAYGRNKVHRPHIASLCGTGNNIRFLTDPTGNRRWLPFEVTSIDEPQENPIDYEGVYGQAYALWRQGFRHWFDREEIKALSRHNQNFLVPDLEEELIMTYFRLPKPGEQGIFMSIAQILERINAQIRQPLSPVKIGIIMRKMGFETVHTRNGQCYRVVMRSFDEIRTTQPEVPQQEKLF